MQDLLKLPFFTDEHRALVRELDTAAWAHIWPDPEKGDDAEALRAALATLAEWGALKHTVSEPWRQMPNVLAREVLAYHSGIADLAYVMQALGSIAIGLMGSDTLKTEMLPAVASGEACMAFAITEPEAGSDLAAQTTRAERVGDEYEITGIKHLISNAGVATHYTLFARTGEGRKGISAFLVPAGTPGLSVEKQRPTSPHPLGRVILEKARVPAGNRLGQEGEGLKLALMTLERCRPTVAAAANGFARRAYDECVKHLRQRRMFGGTLGDQPVAQGILAEMSARLDASRLLTYRTAWLFDQGEHRQAREVALAKWQATENAQWIIDKALQLAGGLGVLHGSVFERLYREIRPLRIYEGASEVQQLVVARAILESP
ncbi:MAG: acyl-CoA dehydrogenase [Planctomycetes bacterium]|jgi:acyl-CoA dehydrogenase|nr:acyl-CoA dehydrogenase [Planctomycetota bacterium]MCL4731108.1 acyl-CoA dehydrogenase [Planctomycetota bacterium]